MLSGQIVDLEDRKKEGARVLLAMSGGVDSAASAVVLQEAGFGVVGITMKNFCYANAEAPPRSCCSMEAIDDARGVCDRLDIPHMVADAEEIFGREVYDNFLTEYEAARTPNPCVRCNTIVRFNILSEYAGRLDIPFIATGHYARIFRSDSGQVYLARAKHAGKDQSYFLSGLRDGDLERVLFPLGGYRKVQVRDTAAKAGLHVSDKPGSQEVCFVPDGTLREFLEGKVPLTPGPIEDTKGNVLGRHNGLNAYTVGQRRGLGIAAGKPMYVVRLDRDRNTLVVGEEASLYCRGLSCTLSWLDPICTGADGRILHLAAQIRSRSKAGTLEKIDVKEGVAQVTFAAAQRAVAPGQTIAFYLGDVVVGSGVIDQAWED